MRRTSAFIGFLVVVIMFFYFKKPRRIVPDQQVSEVSRNSGYITHGKRFDALQNRGEPRKTLGFDPTSRDSLDKYWEDRFDTNVTLVTNIFKSGTNSTRVQITSRRKNRHWGTDGWELYSKIKFQNDCENDQSQSQILDILSEYSAARDSSRLFTGAYAVRFVLWTIHNDAGKSISAEIELEEKMRSPWIVDVSDLEQRNMLIQMETEMYQEQSLRRWQEINKEKEELWGRLKELYGDFPKDLFQRLMAVEYREVFWP
jgi:hypothetical protein